MQLNFTFLLFFICHLLGAQLILQPINNDLFNEGFDGDLIVNGLPSSDTDYQFKAQTSCLNPLIFSFSDPLDGEYSIVDNTNCINPPFRSFWKQISGDGTFLLVNSGLNTTAQYYETRRENLCKNTQYTAGFEAINVTKKSTCLRELGGVGSCTASQNFLCGCKTTGAFGVCLEFNTCVVDAVSLTPPELRLVLTAEGNAPTSINTGTIDANSDWVTFQNTVTTGNSTAIDIQLFNNVSTGTSWSGNLVGNDLAIDNINFQISEAQYRYQVNGANTNHSEQFHRLCLGENATISLQFTTNPFDQGVYIWQTSTDLNNWNNAGTGPTLALNNLEQITYVRFRLFSDTDQRDECSTEWSAPLSLAPEKPGLELDHENLKSCNGENVIFTATPSIPNPESTVNYGLSVLWYQENGTLVQTSNTAPYTFESNTPGAYYAVAQTNLSCSSDPKIFSLDRVDIDYEFTDSDQGEIILCAESLSEGYALGLSNETISSTLSQETSFEWRNETGTLLSNEKALTVTSTGDYTLSYMVDGCSTIKTIRIATHPAPDAPLSNGNITYCKGKDIPALSVTANPGETVKWYDSDDGGNELGQGFNFTPTTAGTYYAESISSFGCASASRTAVTLIEQTLSPDDIQATKDTLLQGQSTTLIAPAGFSYSWNTGETSQSISVSPTTNTRYIVTLSSAEGCQEEKEIDITVQDWEVDITENPHLCSDEDTSILQVLNELPPETTYLWSNGTEGKSTPINQAGNYSVTASIGGTSRSATVEVSKSEFQLNTRSGKCFFNVPIVSSNYPEVSYSLDNIRYQSSSEFSVPSGNYTFYAKDDQSCVYRFQFTLESRGEQIPKHFSPNGDGIRDEWDLSGIFECFTNAEVRIMDRYGRLVKKLNLSNPSWNGYFNGNLLPADDYWYFFDAKDGSGLQQGHFSLIK